MPEMRGSVTLQPGRNPCAGTTMDGAGLEIQTSADQ
jgi:hypothetical protein